MLSIPVAQVVADTEAEGPGRRFAVWVQGCPLRCPGCCNPEMLKFEGGAAADAMELARRAIATPGIEGVSLLGGEPFAHVAALLPFVNAVREAKLSVMIFSGFTLAELRADAQAAPLLALCDLLVDGRYDRTKPEPTVGGRRWIGSANQVMHFLTDRYGAEDPRMRASNTVEIRLDAKGITVNGWPQASRVLT
jgi:anaerobic ribonucleoside-triphosphate reductase activating protein